MRMEVGLAKAAPDDAIARLALVRSDPNMRWLIDCGQTTLQCSDSRF
jgi:hypothetical protein